MQPSPPSVLSSVVYLISHFGDSVFTSLHHLFPPLATKDFALDTRLISSANEGDYLSTAYTHITTIASKVTTPSPDLGQLLILIECLIFFVVGCLAFYQVMVLLRAGLNSSLPVHHDGEAGRQVSVSLTGGKTRTLFISLLSLSNFVRAASLIFLLFIATDKVADQHEYYNSNKGTSMEQLAPWRTWNLAMIQSLPSLLFLCSYSVVILFWAQVYYAARLVSVPLLRPLFILATFLVFSAYIIMAGATRIMNSAEQFERATLWLVGSLHFIVAGCFVYFGVKVGAHLAQQSKPSRTRDSIIRRVLLLSVLCPVIFVLRGILVMSVLFRPAGTKQKFPFSLSPLSWDALIFCTTELLPVLLILGSFWSNCAPPEERWKFPNNQRTQYNAPLLLNEDILKDLRESLKYQQLRDDYVPNMFPYLGTSATRTPPLNIDRSGPHQTCASHVLSAMYHDTLPPGFLGNCSLSSPQDTQHRVNGTRAYNSPQYVWPNQQIVHVTNVNDGDEQQRAGYDGQEYSSRDIRGDWPRPAEHIPDSNVQWDKSTVGGATSSSRVVHRISGSEGPVQQVPYIYREYETAYSRPYDDPALRMDKTDVRSQEYHNSYNADGAARSLFPAPSHMARQPPPWKWTESSRGEVGWEPVLGRLSNRSLPWHRHDQPQPQKHHRLGHDKRQTLDNNVTDDSTGSNSLATGAKLSSVGNRNNFRHYHNSRRNDVNRELSGGNKRLSTKRMHRVPATPLPDLSTSSVVMQKRRYLQEKHNSVTPRAAAAAAAYDDDRTRETTAATRQQQSGRKAARRLAEEFVATDKDDGQNNWSEVEHVVHRGSPTSLNFYTPNVSDLSPLNQSSHRRLSTPGSAPHTTWRQLDKNSHTSTKRADH